MSTFARTYFVHRRHLGLLSRAATALVLSLTALWSAAAPIHYNFENSGTLPVSPTDSLPHDSLSFTRSGVQVNVTAVARPEGGSYGAVTGPGRGVYFGSTGLGVISYTGDGNNLDGANPGATDGDVDEGLVFTFDRVVKLTDINFGSWQNNPPLDADTIYFFVDGVQVLVHSGANDAPGGLSFVGTEFRFLAQDDATGVRIQDLDIEVVPVPGTPTLLAAALLALGAVRRRAMA